MLLSYYSVITKNWINHEFLTDNLDTIYVIKNLGLIKIINLNLSNYRQQKVNTGKRSLINLQQLFNSSLQMYVKVSMCIKVTKPI